MPKIPTVQENFCEDRGDLFEPATELISNEGNSKTSAVFWRERTLHEEEFVGKSE
ncbi:GL14322 [Drosophila persimilis]|uniref:GL14322 n=1 Tax=Drosophila persimilis TaxID=7234 RepID=B4GTC6_DROPE|nr:GL14322 [Drosophila persimilis]